DCCVVLSCVDHVGLSAADQSATAVRAAKLFGLFQARRDRRRPEGIDGARQRIEHTYLEPFPALGSKILIARPEGELRNTLSLTHARDDRRRVLCRVAAVT